jgi:hypothetical protein
MAQRPSSETPEYRLTIHPRFNERSLKYNTRFLLETVKSFASFRYELSVAEEKQGSTIRYTILGLKAPRLDLPASGHARFEREYENLRGPHTVIVKGLDGVENAFAIRVEPTGVRVTKRPASPFVEITTTPEGAS